MINAKQLKAIHTLLGKVGLRDEKEGIISNFTGGRTTSARRMMSEEATALISHLKKYDRKEEACEKMRNKVLSYAHEIGWRIPGTEKVDMARVNNWCCRSGYLKKKLDAYSYDELPKLITQFEAVYDGFLKGI